MTILRYKTQIPKGIKIVLRCVRQVAPYTYGMATHGGWADMARQVAAWVNGLGYGDIAYYDGRNLRIADPVCGMLESLGILTK